MAQFIHQPVLASEVLEAVDPRSGQIFVDGTVGGGGHARLLLEASSPDGRLVGFDQDEMAIEAARENLKSFTGRFELIHANFAEMHMHLDASSCDAVLADLGTSSPQLDVAERGFSFQREGPLDMRMDRRQALTAATIVNEWGAEELARIFWEYGEERESRRLARLIEAQRKIKKFHSTRDLADFIESQTRRMGGRIHPATRVFQALRIAVNRELEKLWEGLEAAWRVLKKDGRLAVITFHSLEDRIVKEFGRRLCRDYDLPGEVDLPELRVDRPARARWLSRKAIIPGEEECRRNPRARSAQLRVLIKLEGEAR